MSGRRSDPISAQSGHGVRVSGTPGRAGFPVFILRMRAVGPHRLPGQRRVSDLRGPSARVFGGGDANPARHRAFSPEADWADIGSDLRPEERGGCPGVVSDLLRVGKPYFSQAEPKMRVDRGRGAW